MKTLIAGSVALLGSIILMLVSWLALALVLMLTWNVVAGSFHLHSLSYGVSIAIIGLLTILRITLFGSASLNINEGK